jgi:hypothetical protein
MLGLFEREGATWNAQQIPSEFSFGEIEPDWDRMGPYLERAMEIVPATMNVGAKKLFCGPESFTPDSGPIVGEAPELKNYYVAAGLNSIGILTGGGAYMPEQICRMSTPNNVRAYLIFGHSLLFACRDWKDSCRVDSQQACTT